jgi:hypothetical protein
VRHVATAQQRQTLSDASRATASATPIRWAASLGADSIDGSGWAIWRNANLPRGLAAAQAASR